MFLTLTVRLPDGNLAFPPAQKAPPVQGWCQGEACCLSFFVFPALVGGSVQGRHWIPAGGEGRRHRFQAESCGGGSGIPAGVTQNSCPISRRCKYWLASSPIVLWFRVLSLLDLEFNFVDVLE